MSHVTRHTSHVTRHTSHVALHTSHVTRHTSHVTRHTCRTHSLSLGVLAPYRSCKIGSALLQVKYAPTYERTNTHARTQTHTHCFLPKSPLLGRLRFMLAACKSSTCTSATHAHDAPHMRRQSTRRSSTCRYRNANWCQGISCLEEVSCCPISGPTTCIEYPVDLKSRSAVNIDPNNLSIFACPHGMVLNGFYRTSENDLGGITKFKCCSVGGWSPS